MNPLRDACGILLRLRFGGDEAAVQYLDRIDRTPGRAGNALLAMIGMVDGIIDQLAECYDVDGDALMAVLTEPATTREAS